jgi:hypothetical protein
MATPYNLSDNNVLLSVGAVLLALVIRHVHHIMTPPPSQGNIPRVSIFKLWLFLQRNQGHEIQYLEQLKPLVDKAGIAQVGQERGAG